MWFNGLELSCYEIWHVRLESAIASCDTSNKTGLHPSLVSRIHLTALGTIFENNIMASKLGIKPFENCPNEHLKKAEKMGKK